jgi:hypothetical protein
MSDKTVPADIGAAFNLPRGNMIEIRLREKVSRDELQKIKQAFEFLADLSFVADEPAVGDDDQAKQLKELAGIPPDAVFHEQEEHHQQDR